MQYLVGGNVINFMRGCLIYTKGMYRYYFEDIGIKIKVIIIDTLNKRAALQVKRFKHVFCSNIYYNNMYIKKNI